MTHRDQSSPPESRHVHFLVLPEVQLLDLAGPVQVFDSAVRAGANYTMSFVGAVPEIRTAQGLHLSRLDVWSRVRPGDLVVVPGIQLDPDDLPEQLITPSVIRWLQDAVSGGAHLASVCTGALVLGEAGLLDDRRCTVHWAHLQVLQGRHPRARVQDGVLFVHDGSISTSAGITSGIDLALSLVERDYGSILAAKAARDLVVYMRRNGQAGPPSVYLQYRTHLHGGVHRVQDYLMQNPVRQASDEVLAQLAGLTVRGLARAFKVQTGLSMSEYRTRLQLEVARELMLDPRLTLEEISNRSGFSDPRHFRRTWKAIFGHPPSVSRLTPHPISASEKVTPSLTRRGAGNPPLQPIVEHDA